MRKSLSVLFVTAVLLLAVANGRAQSDARIERITVSYLLGLGRAPAVSELNDSSVPADSPIANLLEHRRHEMQSDTATKRAAIAKACADAFGREPSEIEISAWSEGARTYSELMALHLKSLAEHPAEYEHVINRAYQFLIHRDVYSLELAYWKTRDTLPYDLLVACLESWARRNQPGLMVTSGTPVVSINSDYLTTARLSPAIALEARAAAGLPPMTADVANPAAFGRNLIAPGAGEIISSGHICFAAIGGPNLLPAHTSQP
jgi:hypothetical protein